jgi:hypothetical protein
MQHLPEKSSTLTCTDSAQRERDFRLIKDLLDLLVEYNSKGSDGQNMMNFIGDLVTTINKMDYRHGSVKSKMVDIPWDHFTALQEIASGNSEIARELLPIFQDKQFCEALNLEFRFLQKRLSEIQHDLSKEIAEKDGVNVELEQIDADNQLLDEDDSLLPDIENFTTLRSISNFYRDHTAIGKVIELLDSAKRIPSSPRMGEIYAGLIIAIAEEMKKLSYPRRVGLHEIEAPSLGNKLTHQVSEKKMNLLARLWLYKKARDAVRHAADYPEYQLEELKRLFENFDDYAHNFYSQIDEDLDELIKYSKQTLNAERKQLSRGWAFLKENGDVKVKGEAEAKKVSPSKKKPKDAGDGAWPDLSAVNPFADSFSDKEYDLYGPFLAKNGEGDPDKLLGALKVFLMSADIEVLGGVIGTVGGKELKKDNLPSKKAAFGAVMKKFRFAQFKSYLAKAIKEKESILKGLEDILENRDARAILQGEINQLQQNLVYSDKIQNYVLEYFNGSSLQKGEKTTKKADEQKNQLWGHATFSDFFNEYLVCRKTERDIATNISLQRMVEFYVTNRSLFHFLANELIAKGFAIHPSALEQLRIVTDTADEKYDHVFSALVKRAKMRFQESFPGHAKSAEVALKVDESESNPMLDEIYGKFMEFFFKGNSVEGYIRENEAQFIKMRKALGENQVKLGEQFHHIFYNPNKVEVKNNKILPVVYDYPLDQSEWGEYESLGSFILNIRMLSSRACKEKLKGHETGEVILQLQAERIAKKFQLHFRNIKERLEGTAHLLKTLALEEEKPSASDDKEKGEGKQISECLDLADCKTLKEVNNKLGHNFYLLATNMSLISQHVMKITSFSDRYLSQHLNDPAVLRQLNLQGEKGLADKLQECIFLLRACGNYLAHMDLTKPQLIDKVFGGELKDILRVLDQTLIVLNNLIMRSGSAVRQIHRLLAHGFLDHCRKTSGQTADAFQKPAEFIVEKLYPHSMGGLLAAFTTFGALPRAIPKQDDEAAKAEEKDSQNTP